MVCGQFGGFVFFAFFTLQRRYASLGSVIRCAIVGEISDEYPCLAMSRDSLGDGGYALHRGRPPYGEFGREIGFRDLPGECQKLVTDVYLDLWSFTG